MSPAPRRVRAVSVVLAGLGLAGASPALGATTTEPLDLAVVEMRSGSAQLPALGERLAAMARRLTHLTVAAPAEVRRRAGGEVEAQLVRCEGDAACLSALGESVGARSLLVVAVSQLGDVIVALQVLETASRRVTGRLAEPLSHEGTLDDGLLRQWLERLLPSAAFVRYGTLSVRSDVLGATVAVDGQPRGASPVAPLRLQAPRRYELTVSKPGRRPFQMTVELQPDKTVEVMASLPPRTVSQPWYKRPWFWAGAVGLLGAGTIVGIQLATTDPSTVNGRVTVKRDGM